MAKRSTPTKRTPPAAKRQRMTALHVKVEAEPEQEEFNALTPRRSGRIKELAGPRRSGRIIAAAAEVIVQAHKEQQRQCRVASQAARRQRQRQRRPSRVPATARRVPAAAPRPRAAQVPTRAPVPAAYNPGTGTISTTSSTTDGVRGNGVAFADFGFEMGTRCFGLCLDEARNMLYVGSESGMVEVLNATTKQHVRSLKLSHGVRCIVADESFVFVGCNNGTVYDISADRPRLVAEIEGFEEVLSIGMNGGKIVAADASGHIALLNCEGEVVWRRAAAQEDGKDGWVALVDQTGVYHGSSKGLAKFELARPGKQVWARDTAGALLGNLGSLNGGHNSHLFAALSDPDCRDSEMAKRLSREGAKTGEVVVSLMWNNIDDLDLRVITPSGETIFYGHKNSICAGELDVDMNCYNYSKEPVENIFWDTAPHGEYEVAVNQYSNRTGDKEVPYEVHVNVRGTVTKYHKVWKQGTPKTQQVTTFTVGAPAPVAAKANGKTKAKKNHEEEEGAPLKSCVVAVDCATGAVDAVLPTGDSVPSTTATRDGKMVYAAVRGGISAFDPNNEGRATWTLSTDTVLGKPVGSGANCTPMTMVTSPDGNFVYALCGTRMVRFDVSATGVKNAQANKTGTFKLLRRCVDSAVVSELGGVADLSTASAGDSGVRLVCVKEGSKLRVRPEEGQPGFDASVNCQFPRNLRVDGRRFLVDSLVTSSGGFYRVQGDIKVL